MNELYLEIGERDKLLETMQYGGIKSGRSRGAPRGKGRERGAAVSSLGKRAKADGYVSNRDVSQYIDVYICTYI